ARTTGRRPRGPSTARAGGAAGRRRRSRAAGARGSAGPGGRAASRRVPRRVGGRRQGGDRTALQQYGAVVREGELDVDGVAQARLEAGRHARDGQRVLVAEAGALAKEGGRAHRRLAAAAGVVLPLFRAARPGVPARVALSAAQAAGAA